MQSAQCNQWQCNINGLSISSIPSGSPQSIQLSPVLTDLVHYTTCSCHYISPFNLHSDYLSVLSLTTHKLAFSIKSKPQTSQLTTNQSLHCPHHRTSTKHRFSFNFKTSFIKNISYTVLSNSLGYNLFTL